jgi:predicted nucleic acid-binding protein
LILDTNAVSALADGDPTLLTAASGVTRFSLPVVVLGEFRFGIARSRYRARYTEWLRQLADVSAVLLIDDETAAHYAAVREKLRAKGQPIPSNDTWIAALALQHRMPVMTRDEHFDLVDGIERLTW